MRDAWSRSCRFALAGIVNLAAYDRPNRSTEKVVAQAFESTVTDVRLIWRGTGITALATQSPEDVSLDSGSYVLEVPQVRSCQGIVYGWFFDHAGGPFSPAIATPEAVSAAFVQAYVDRGVEGLSYFNGGWVGAIWNPRERRVVFARDVAGVETMYVARRGSQIVFASDLRVFEILEVAEALDEQSIAEFLHYLYVPAPRSVYEGIYAVLPGHALIVDEHNMEHKRFAPSRFVLGDPFGDEGKVAAARREYLPEFEDLLKEAVQDCLPNQGRVGLLLSGGKDSSALAIAISQVAPDRVVALTAGSQDSYVDESKDAARLCEFLDLPHHIYTPRSRELLHGIQRLACCQDQPFGDPASLPLLLTLDHLPDDVSMVWDGTGNDYYFGIVASSGIWKYQRRIDFQRIIPTCLWPTFLDLMLLMPPRFRSQAEAWKLPIEESFVSWNGFEQKELTRLWQRQISFSDTLLWQRMREGKAKDWREIQTEIVCGGMVQ